MIRATLAVGILLASIFVLGQNLIDSQNDEAVSAEPLLIEIPIESKQIPTERPDFTGVQNHHLFELVDHVEPLNVPEINTLAQRWGGRSSFRSRARQVLSPPVVRSTQPWQAAPEHAPPAAPTQKTSPNPASTDEGDDIPMAELGKPIEAPATIEIENVDPAAKPTSARPTPARRYPAAQTQQDFPSHDAPSPKTLKALSKPEYIDDGFDAVGIVDPADPRVRQTLRTPTPTRSPADEAIDNNRSADVIDSQSTQREQSAPADVVPAKPRYFDNDWYQSTRLSSAMLSRKKRIAQTLDHYYGRPLNSKDDSPWSLMHTMIAWGSDSYIRAGGPNGRSVGTVHWLANNGLSDGVRLLTANNGKIGARTGAGLQGHDGQFLAMLAQTRVRESYPLSVSGYDFTVRDLIELEKGTCKSDEELTFKLIGLSHYLEPDEVWRAETGTRWSIPKLINAEIAAPINGVTCGGTHRLMGLKYAVRMRRRAGMPVDGEWARAEKYTSDYVSLALSQQNDDGSFSSNFFRGKGSWGDNDRKFKTTGHILEYVVFSLPHESLADQRVTQAVDYLTAMMMENRYYDWPKGPLGHAIRALSLYNERVFNIPPGQRRAAAQTAARSSQSNK